MTNMDKKKFDEWAVGQIKRDSAVNDLDYEDGAGFIDSLESVPRVIYLKSLGYTIDSWEGYAMAEINEMGKVA